jgi:dipeptide/tripeptide permease
VLLETCLADKLAFAERNRVIEGNNLAIDNCVFWQVMQSVQNVLVLMIEEFLLLE